MKIVLGSAQFGLDYGINNKQGKIPLQEAFKILDFALENGIEFIDSAENYGESLEVVGSYIKNKNSGLKIISKIHTMDAEKIEKELLKKLNINKIHTYIIHDFEKFLENPTTIEVLKKLKKEGKIEKIGFSAYYPGEVEYLLDNNVDFDVIQLPFSVFDQRFGYLFRRLKQKDIEIQVRSVFLQGLLFKSSEEIEKDKRFYIIKPKIIKLRQIAEELNISLASLLLNFVYSNENIDKIIIGVNSLENLKQNLDSLNDREKVKKVYNRLLWLREDNEKIILPMNWTEIPYWKNIKYDPLSKINEKTKMNQNKKIIAVIQARAGGSRLPGKMLKLINEKPVISYIVNAAKKSKLINEIILATVDSEEENKLLEIAGQQGIKSFAGSEEDVLDRVYQAVKNQIKDNEKENMIVVRLTGDCPLHDSEVIDKVIKNFLNNPIDYSSNIHPPTYPDGLDVEVFSFNALEKAWREARLPSERQHVTPYIWKNKDLFKILNIAHSEDLNHMRWTLDEQSDFDFIKAIIEKLRDEEINIQNVLRVLRENPDLEKINQKFGRNEGYEKSLREDNIKGEKITEATSDNLRYGEQAESVSRISEKKSFKKNKELLEKAKKIIPTASQTYSKSYNYFCGDVSFLEKGKGGRVWDVDENSYLDFILGLGAVTIGYNNDKINNKIKEQLEKGISFSMPTELEVKLAEKLIGIIPSAEMVKFVKNGSDATTACIRLARAYTKKNIIACCGYHGYHDWYIGTTDNDLGIPLDIKRLTKTFPYNDIESLKRIFNENKNEVACVILEPLQANGPKEGFLEEVKKLCFENNCVLIFDEVVSGFRSDLGGAQKLYEVIPDLSAFGKGIGNGASISAVVGKKDIMKLIDKGAFISTTFGGETIGLVSALEVIEILEGKGNMEHIIALGDRWKNKVRELINNKNLQEVVEIYGISPHCGVIFKDYKNLSSKDFFSVYQQTLIENGILSVGINNFCLAHTKEDVDKFVKAVDFALDEVKKAVDRNNVEGLIKGRRFEPVFKR